MNAGPLVALGEGRLGACLLLAKKVAPMFLYTLIAMINYLVNIIVIVVIVQFVLSLLIAFNVVNMHNNAVAAVWKALNAILEPLLRPIRRIMPDTGAIDFSPMVLIIGLNLLTILLSGLAASGI